MTTIVDNFNIPEFFGSAYQSLVDAGIDQQINDETRYPLVEVSIPEVGHKWLLTEYYPADDTAFALCDLGMQCAELGYISLTEIFEATANLGLQPKCRIMNAIHKIDEYISASATEIVMLPEATSTKEMPLTQFLADYQGALLQAVQRDLPPLFNDNKLNQAYELILIGLARQPLGGQREKIHAVLTGLIEQNLEAVILNGEMGTGKTYMSIAVAEVYHKVWNPLEQSLETFLQQHNNFEITYKENNKPYPTADIIADWVSDNISEHLSQQ
ncbi:MAG: DUF2958 domain-containing protein [Ostreibacterium sp.]